MPRRRWSVRLAPKGGRRRALRIVDELVSDGGDLILRDIRQNTARGVDAHGRSLGRYKSGPRKGRRVRLRRSGALFDTATARRRKSTSTVRPRAKYARYVLGRYAVFEIGDKAERRLDRLAQAAFDRFLERHKGA